MKKTTLVFFSLIALSGCSTAPSENQPLSSKGDQLLDARFFDEAVAANSMNQCDQILDNALKTECQNIINASKITELAVNDADIKNCKKINIERYKSFCESRVNERLEAKNADEKRLKIGKAAIESNNASLCNQIKDEGQEASCKYNVLANLAIEKQDPSLCEQIGRKDLIEQCKESIK